MRWLFPIILAGGCGTMTIRAGAVKIGDRAAFQASIAVGVALGNRQSVQLVHEHGVTVLDRAAYVGAMGADLVITNKDNDNDVPTACIGPRVRFDDASAAVLATGCLFTGVGADPKTHSGGLGFELGAGVDTRTGDAVLETSVVRHGRWPVF